MLEERSYRDQGREGSIRPAPEVSPLSSVGTVQYRPDYPGLSEMALDRQYAAASVEKHYMALYRRLLDRQTSDLRVFVINRAADYVLGKEGIYWVTSGPFSPARPRRVNAGARFGRRIAQLPRRIT